jgi:hypothetical protein
MEVHFNYTRSDWAAINSRAYRNWLYSLRPLAGTEYAICWFFLFFSLLAGGGLLVFLGVSIWLSLAWYYVVGSVVLLVFVGGMFLEVVRPRREPVRGLFHELAFRMKLEAQLLAKERQRNEGRLRRQQQQGRLELGHRYSLRADERGCTLIIDHPASWDASARQENRNEWSGVRAIEKDTDGLCIVHSDGSFVLLPHHAFADDDHCRRVAAALETYHAAAVSPAADRPPGSEFIQAAVGHLASG